jgi:hypothetical protein
MGSMGRRTWGEYPITLAKHWNRLPRVATGEVAQ